MEPSPTPPTDPNSNRKLLLLWAIFASASAALFALLALLLFLNNREHALTLPAHAEESSAPSAEPAVSLGLPPNVYLDEGFDLLFKKHQLAGAIAAFEACIRDHPDCADAYHGLAVAQRDAGDYAIALHNHDLAIQLASDRPAFYWERGVTCQRLKDHDAAVTTFHKGLELHETGKPGGPGFAPGNLHAGLAQCYRAKGDLPKALHHCEQAIALNPRSDWFYKERAYTYQAMGDRERADADFTKASQVLKKPR